MMPLTTTSDATIRCILAAGLALALCSCGLFEPRTPQNPSQSGQDNPPALDAPTVITNLTNAVVQKNENNYIRCFADPATAPRLFIFLPASDGIAQYGSILSAWSRTDELNYFRNLHARSGPTAVSNLVLSEKSPPNVTADSVVYYYDYQFDFEHNDATFPKTARGSLIFTLAPDNTGQWSIFRWIDFKSGPDITWSMFKGKFSS